MSYTSNTPVRYQPTAPIPETHDEESSLERLGDLVQRVVTVPKEEIEAP